MQYEVIILELLSRIKKLEEEVSELKQIISANTTQVSDDDNIETFVYQDANDSCASYKKMTDEMIDVCYEGGKKLADGESVQELADEIADKTGMNRNSAIMYLYAVQGMLTGTIYKRAISSKATKKYYDIIFDEYGREGLNKAILATRLHVDYRRECGHTVDSIEYICEEYEKML